MKAQSGEVAESGSFIEHVEVPQSKLLVHLFSDFKHSLLLFG
jgi:hypothetical protein